MKNKKYDFKVKVKTWKGSSVVQANITFGSIQEVPEKITDF